MTYLTEIKEFILADNDRKGISLPRIKKMFESKIGLQPHLILKALRTGVANGELTQKKSHYKLAHKPRTPSPKKAKKPIEAASASSESTPVKKTKPKTTKPKAKTTKPKVAKTKASKKAAPTKKATTKASPAAKKKATKKPSKAKAAK